MTKYIGVWEPVGDGSRDRGEASFVLALSASGIVKRKSSMPTAKKLDEIPLSEILSVDYYRSDHPSGGDAAAGALAGAVVAGVAGAIVGGLAASGGKMSWYVEIVTASRKLVFRLNLDRDKNTFVKWAEGQGLLRG